MTTALVIDLRTHRHVEMEVTTEDFLRRQLAAALAENATLVATARVLADQVVALKRWKLRALIIAPWLHWVVREATGPEGRLAV